MNATQNAKASTKANAKDAAAKAHAAKAGTAKADDHTPATKPAAKRTKPAAHPQEKKADVTRTTPKLQENANAPQQPDIPERREGDRRANSQLQGDAAMKFMVGQMQAQPPAPPVDMEAFNAELKALQEKFGVQANVTVKAPRNTGVKQNGITRPGADTASGKIWAAADEISAKTHSVAPISLLREHPAMKGVNEATMKTQYARWRQFHNVSGRLPRIHTLQQEQGVYDAALPNIVGGDKSK